MAAPIDFYFDFTSPYGYFAGMRIDALAAKYGREVAWHPVLLGVVFKATGSGPLPSLPMKGPYSMHDIQRTARFHHIRYTHPENFPLPTQNAARAALWVRNTEGNAKAAEFGRAVFQALFVDGEQINEPEVLTAIAQRLGLDANAMREAIASQQIKDQLRVEIEQAMARNVFGSPFIIVDDEPFWGFDRFDQIEAMLQHGRI